jgi:hypothetical protein
MISCKLGLVLAWEARDEVIAKLCALHNAIVDRLIDLCMPN